jgi:uncharacterized phage protein (TIGR02220 family)|tara:strand:+ start:1679 stop:2329 length:651 start_codon:yes stop_codon:yes gene_type:complete
MSRGFKGIWIPKEIWESKEMSMQEKVFLAEIHSLDNENGCIASNAYFAEFFGLSKSSVSRVVSSLSKKELIVVTLLYKDNKEVDKRIIRCKKYGNKEIKVIEKEKPKAKVPSMSVDFVSEIVDYLNEKANRRLRVGYPIKKLVNARVSEGYNLDDFKHVIDVKCSQWLGTDFEKFLRPSTLFNATRFTEYHSEKLKASKDVKSEEITNSQIGFYDV